MNINSVRELKAAVVETISTPRRAANSPTRSLGLLVSPFGAGPALGSVALGIARGCRAGDYRVAVRASRRTPEIDRIVAQIDDVAGGETDVAYVGRIAARSDEGGIAAPAGRRRPLIAGISVAHASVTAGTLGAVARCRRTGARVIVSNNHVLADEDRAEAGDEILQPGTSDGGVRGKDAVATLLRWQPLRRSGNRADAAVATIIEGIAFEVSELPGLGRLNGVRAAPLDPGDMVSKIGRTTGVTRGVVTAIELDALDVAFDGRDCAFDGQVEIGSIGRVPFSAAGDSGALILDAELCASGLLFAGSQEGGPDGCGVTYANGIGAVMDLLGIDLALGSAAA